MDENINIKDLNQFNYRFDSLIDSAIHNGVKLLFAVIILIIGLWIGNKLTKSFKKVMVAKEVEPSLSSFLTSLVNIILKVLVVIIVLTTVGIEMTSIVAILGAASLAIGMALSGTLQNFAGGVVILLFKPFKVGDFIETDKGSAGTVQAIYIFTTKLKTPDNRIVYIPNGGLSNGIITNYNQEDLRRVDCTFGISYGENVQKARVLILEILAKDERVHKTLVPIVFLSELGESSVNLVARFWSNPSDVFPIKWDLNEKVYNEFGQDSSLNFPFPQMDIHIKQK